MKSNTRNGKASKTNSKFHVNKKVAGGTSGAGGGAVMGGPEEVQIQFQDLEMK